ncbi:hypothetical protein PT2222_400018 [Paraburkholderia tropica]
MARSPAMGTIALDNKKGTLSRPFGV